MMFSLTEFCWMPSDPEVLDLDDPWVQQDLYFDSLAEAEFEEPCLQALVDNYCVCEV